MDSKKFYSWLSHDSGVWVQEGIITTEQQQKILARYVTKPQEPSPNLLPTIFFIIATVLLAVSLIWYCAANWDMMSRGVKLFQIFTIVIGFYTLAYYFLVQRPSTLGRVFTVLGIVSFGVAIMLIAQIYHISSRPTNGILLWAIVALATSWIAKENWGLLLSIFLFWMWGTLEIVDFENPSLLVFVIVPIIGLASYHIRSRLCIILLCLLSFMWFFQFNVFYLDKAYNSIRNLIESDGLLFLRASFLLLLPFGVILIAISRHLEGREFWDMPSKFLGVLGWLSFFCPLTLFFIPWEKNAWNFYTDPGWLSFSSLFNHDNARFVLWEYGILIVVLVGLIGWLWYQGKKPYSVASIGAFAIFGINFPVNPGSWFSLAMILGMLLGFFVLIYFSVSLTPRRAWELLLGDLLMAYVLLHEAMAFLVSGILHTQWQSRNDILLAHISTFLLFLLACILIRQCARILLPTYEKINKLPLGIIACVGFVLVYVAAFKHNNPLSIWGSTTPSLIILMLQEQVKLLSFIIIGLWSWLVIKSQQRHFLFMLLFIFVLLLISTIDMSNLTIMIVFNLLLLAVEIAIIYYSIIVASRALAIIGTLFFIIHIWTRHIDLGWGFMEGAILFFITGAALLLVGFILERVNRRKAQKQLQETTVVAGEKP